MNCYEIKKVDPDGYVTLVATDNNYQKEIPLISAKIMFESGALILANPEVIYTGNNKSDSSPFQSVSCES